ncbi:HIT family protein [Candidatus Woesearchaeota archaeon]|nr:HIT family protein [Candidatus Woesearchaeota archaeon]
MTACDICEMIAKKDDFKVVYEDDKVVALLHETPAFIGHTLLFTKEHFRIIEELSDELTSHVFNVANKISTAIFEALNVHGTNILVNNGADAGQTHAHFGVNIIPRTEQDGISLEWPMQQADPKKLEDTSKLLNDFVMQAVSGAGVEKTVKMDDVVIKSDEDDYMIKQLKRMP